MRPPRRFRLLSLALVLVLLASFGLYFGLQTGLDLLAGFFFGWIIAGLGLAIWVG